MVLNKNKLTARKVRENTIRQRESTYLEFQDAMVMARSEGFTEDNRLYLASLMERLNKLDLDILKQDDVERNKRKW